MLNKLYMLVLLVGSLVKSQQLLLKHWRHCPLATRATVPSGLVVPKSLQSYKGVGAAC